MFSGAKKKAQGTVSSVTANRRLLVVDVLDARNIIACDSKKLTSDSYVHCSLLDLGDREIKAETATTQHVKGTINPQFNQRFTFGINNKILF
jgi:Ca2+-dependent lipid-binding protein